MKPRITLDRGEDLGSGLMLTPLIDIMFLVTIFFVLTSSYSSRPALEVNLPQAQTARPAVRQELAIVIHKDGSLEVNGRGVTMESLVAVLQQESGGRSPETVLLLGDQEVPYGLLIQVMDRVRALGWENLSLVTRSGRSEG